MPGTRFLLLHAAGPVEVRPAEEVLEGDAVRDERDPGQDDEDRDSDQQGDERGYPWLPPSVDLLVTIVRLAPAPVNR